MKSLFIVFIGGGGGCVMRYVLSQYITCKIIKSFFYGTFAVNILGCLLIGVILTLSDKSDLLSQNQKLLLATGFCGGFTTFSTFIYESKTLIKSGDIVTALWYTMFSVLVGFLAVLLGVYIAKYIQ